MTTEHRRMYGIGLLAFVLFLSTLIGVPVLPALSQDLGATPTAIPVVVSASLATVVIAQLFTGFLSDRYSKRSMVLVGALTGSVSSLLCAVAVSWWQILSLRVLGGMADAIAMPALLAVTASLGKDQPGRFFGILRSSQGLSFAIGPALGSLFSLAGLRAPFIADGLFSLAAFLAAVVLFKDSEKQSSEHDLRLLSGLRSVFHDKRVYVYLLMGISGLFGWGILGSFVPTKAQMVGLEAWQIGLIISGGAILFSLVSYTIGVVTDKFGRKAFVIASQGVIVVAVIGLSYSSSFVGLLVFYGLFCIGEAITYLLCFVYASGAFEKRYIATSMAVFDSVMDFSLLLGPAIAVLSYGLIGRIEPIFLIAMLPAVVALFVTPLWLPKGVKSITSP